MHWGAEMSDGLTALQTIRPHRAWDTYWYDRVVLSLVA